MNPLWVSSLANIFSYSEDCSYLSLKVSFRYANVFKVNSASLSDLWFIFHYAKRWIHKELAAINFKVCAACIFLKTFYWILTFRSFIYSKLVIACSVKGSSHFLLFVTV